jgi:hypothetical protein
MYLVSVLLNLKYQEKERKEAREAYGGWCGLESLTPALTVQSSLLILQQGSRTVGTLNSLMPGLPMVYP